MTMGYYGNVVRLVVAIALVVYATGEFAFHLTSNWVVTICASLAMACAGAALAVWRLRTSQAIHGFDRGSITATRVVISILMLVTFAGTYGLELLAYSLTRERFVEALVVLIVGAPSFFLLHRAECRALDPPKPNEAGTQRTSAIWFSIVFALMARSLFVELTGNVPFAGDGYLRTSTVALGMMFVAFYPIVLYFMYERYRAAKGRTTGIVA